MSESKSSRHTESEFAELAKIGNPAKRAEAAAALETKQRKRDGAKDFKPAPVWYKALMFSLLILGLLWIVTYYIAAMVAVEIPIPGIGNYNILIGFGIALVGFIMMMGWRD